MQSMFRRFLDLQYRMVDEWRQHASGRLRQDHPPGQHDWTISVEFAAASWLG